MRWIVVGAGSGGCVAAARLAEDPSHEVVLLEHGPDLPPGASTPAIDGADFLATFGEPGRSHEGLTARRAGVPLPYRRGRGVGGSSLVNAMIALRGDGGQYAGWGWDDVDAAWARVQIPAELPDDDELGPIDRALLAADPAARRVPLTRRGGRRITSAEAYLWPVWDRPNFSVRADTAVAEVVLDGDRAVGVRTAAGAELPADRVVLAAGAIHTPWLLQQSGVVTPGVGSGLQDHPAVSLTLELEDRAPGGLAAGAFSVHGPVQLLALNHTGGETAARGYGALLIGLMEPHGPSGAVRPGAGPEAPPAIELGPLSDRRDLAALATGVRRARALFDSEGFRSAVREVYVDDHGTRLAHLADDRLTDWIPAATGTYLHATSTCAMGRVVDDAGRVRGTSALYVCDASVFPAVPHVNPHLPTVMLAERLAARWGGS